MTHQFSYYLFLADYQLLFFHFYIENKIVVGKEETENVEEQDQVFNGNFCFYSFFIDFHYYYYYDFPYTYVVFFCFVFFIMCSRRS